MTDKQLETVRNNGAKSKGHVTAEGKARSSQNACRHQLTSERLVLNSEEQAEFDRMFAAYRERLQPRNEIETDLVEQMAAAKWRERRCWLLQKSLLEYNVAAMERWWNRPPFRLHYLTAREAYNLVKAAEAGHSGDPNDFRIRKRSSLMIEQWQDTIPARP